MIKAVDYNNCLITGVTTVIWWQQD
jgi:hypothetical protein